MNPETGQAVDAKYVGNPDISPFVPDSGIPDFIREKILAGQESEFYRYGQVIGDSDNPLVGLQVITNNSDAAEYFEGLMQQYGIPGEVIVVAGG